MIYIKGSCRSHRRRWQLRKREDRTIRDLSSITAGIGFWEGLTDLSGEESIVSLLKCFTNLFPYRYNSVIKRLGTEKWLDISRFHCLSDQEILESLQANAKLHRGFRCDGKTMFVSLRIPAASRYHNSSTITEIRQALKRIAVVPRHYQIDDDWYLYIFLKSSAPAAEICDQLKYWCILQGLVVGLDTLEILPNDIPMPFPLAGKFSWLNERCQFIIRRDELSLEKALAFFLDDAGQVAVDVEDLCNSLKRTGSFLKSVLEPIERHNFETQTAKKEIVAETPAVSDAEVADLDEVPSSSIVPSNVISMTFDRTASSKTGGARHPNPFRDASLSKEELQTSSVTFLEMEQVEFSTVQDDSSDNNESRLVIFHEPADLIEPNDEEKQKLADLGAQLLLFPVQEPSVSQVFFEPEPAPTISPVRKRRKDRSKPSD